MNKIFLICFFLASCSISLAQKNTIDSLKNEMDRYTKKDTIRIKKIIDYSRSLFKTSPEKGVQLLKEAEKLAKELNWQSGRIDILLNLSKGLSFQQKYDLSIPFALEALKLAEANNDHKKEAIAHYSLSESYRLFDNDSLKNYHAQKMLAIATDLQNKSLMKEAFMLVGASYADQSEWEKAEVLFDKVLKLADKKKDARIRNQILMFKGNRLSEQKEFSGAVRLLKECLLYYQKEKDYQNTAYLHAQVGYLYAELRIKDSAYLYAKTALILSKENLLTKELTDAYKALSYANYTFKDYKEAYEYRIIYDSLYNKIYNVESGQNAERVRMEMAQEKKDALAKVEEIKKTIETKKTRNLLFTGIGFFMLLAVFLFWNNRQKQKSKLILEKAYSNLKSTQSQLIQAEKMASLGELTAGIAHEIQNPLNFVNNFSEVSSELLEEMNEELNKGDIDEAKAISSYIKQNLEKINHHGKRADAIVKGMLQHSRSSSGTKEPTDINKLADEYLRLAYHGLRAKDKSFNSTLVTNFDETIGKIEIIPQEIGRVILNLITNAFYATNEKSHQIIEGYEPTVSVSTIKTGNTIEISIKDNANGIPQKVLDKIFQPFFTTKPTGQGTGLGLSLAYDIVKAHGGELKVNTGENVGTEFCIILPL